MLTASQPARRRLPATAGPRTRLASRALRVGGALTAIAALTLPASAALPARADTVRSAEQWVLNALDVPVAWQQTQGSGVLVAVIDSGVDGTVPDLTGQVTTGPDLTGVSTAESSPGWGVHGTWMASLIAGHGHGGGGIVGIAPQAKILSIRVITDKEDPDYGQFQAEGQSRIQRELARAIRYAVAHRAGVISMSLGYAEPSLTVRSAVLYAVDHGAVVVASAGNSGASASAASQGQAPYSYPANYPGVLGVAAVNKAGAPATFSSENLSVEVAAPGVNVPAAGRGGKYWLVSGTSPACALTAGIAALIKSRYRHLSAAQVRQAIFRSTLGRPALGYNDHVGFGSVDAAAALAEAGKLAGSGQTAGAGRTAGVPAVSPASPASHFGGGPAAAPPVPVPGRSSGQLVVLGAVAVLCLCGMILAARQLATGRASRRRLAAAGGPAPALPYAPVLPYADARLGWPAGGAAAAGGPATAGGPAQPGWAVLPNSGFVPDGSRAASPAGGWPAAPGPGGPQLPPPGWLVSPQATTVQPQRPGTPATASPGGQAEPAQADAAQAGAAQAGTNQAGTNQAGTNQAGTNQAGAAQADASARRFGRQRRSAGRHAASRDRTRPPTDGP